MRKSSSVPKTDLKELQKMLDQLAAEAKALKIPVVRQRMIEDFRVVLTTVQEARKP